MIHKIYANDPRFKRVEFQSGLNVIIANKKLDSGKRDTRNGVGKTILIKIIHFCLGADVQKLELPLEQIKNWIFSIEIDLDGKYITASRSIANPKIISLQEKNKQPQEIMEKEWKKRLGAALFHIPSTSNIKHIPTFRGLIHYFIRDKQAAYLLPFSYFGQQSKWSVQLNNAFLLGLNWKYTSEINEIFDEKKNNQDLVRLSKSRFKQSLGEMRTEKIRLQEDLNTKEEAISSFKVYPQYQDIQKQVNELTQKIHDYVNENIFQKAKLDQYVTAINSEEHPSPSVVERLYKEVGLHFPNNVKKTLEEARDFHTKIIKNRKDFLQVEVDEIKTSMEKNENNMEVLISQRAKHMKILETHGALEEYTLLQGSHIEQKEKLERIEAAISDIEHYSSRQKELKQRTINVEKKMERDHKQNEGNWQKAVSSFNENTQALYNQAGNLIIELSEQGYKFNVDIGRKGSEGIKRMEIFCYDLMLVETLTEQGKINFMIHDSTLFDAVDSRQRALAIQHAHVKSKKQGFQYICLLNTDMIPSGDFSPDFDINSFVRLSLGDQKPSESLLGFRFNL